MRPSSIEFRCHTPQKADLALALDLDLDLDFGRAFHRTESPEW
jgi:hypothetical protein